MLARAASPATVSTTKIARRWLVSGQVLCHEGDPPGPAYVICSGRVRIYRRDPAIPDRTVELAQLGTGDVIGELAPLLQQPRSATVQAIEPTQILEIALDQLTPLLQSQAPLQRVIAAALKDRSGLDAEQLAAVAARLGVSLPATAPAEPGASPTQLPPPAHDKNLVYTKTVDCPACGCQFVALMPQVRKAKPGERSSDFHQLYRTPFNPADYEVWVCPNDLYAAFPSDFGELRPAHAERVVGVVAQVVSDWGGQRVDFNTDRTLALREKSLLLARALYQLRQAPVLRQAAVLHRLAWCARERGDLQRERQWLGQALAAYTVAYHQTDLGTPKEELRILYLCGELSARLGDTATALTWFAQALRHPALRDNPSWERLLRERWTSLRQPAP
jgi:uncharacterized protein